MLTPCVCYKLVKAAATFAFIVFCGASAPVGQAATVDVYPGADIPSMVAANPAGTTFVIYPGMYRLTQSITPKDGDSFIGQTACAPPTTSCPAILSGSTTIGPSASFDGTNYEVVGETQQGTPDNTIAQCQLGWEGCIYPEDLFFDGVPYKHLHSASLPTILSGQWWFDYANNIIYFHDNPAGHVVETSVVPSAFDSTANNVTISQLTIEEFAVPVRLGVIEMSGNASLTQGINWTVKNCEILRNHGSGVRPNFGMHILNNYIHNNGAIGIAGGTATNATTQSTPSGIVISNNTISYNNYAHVANFFSSGGIKFGATKGVVIRGNTISHNDGTGIHFDTSSQSPLIDGNTVTDNTGGSGIAYEISLTSATIRNNLVLRNGVPDANAQVSSAGIGSYASVGVEAYCNVVEVPNASGASAMVFVASNRGSNIYPPYEYLVSTGNHYHHNTVIWDGTRGAVWAAQHDSANQPNFFSLNPVFDYNTYHLPSLTMASFLRSTNNTAWTFAQFQAAGQDVHGSADTNTTSGFPTVAITSPADQSSFANSVTVAATASDRSGINKVEFYVDWSLQATLTSPYNFNWTNGATGTHTVAAVAYSNAGIRSCYAVTLLKQ